MRGNKTLANAVLYGGVVHVIGAVQSSTDTEFYYDEALSVDWSSGQPVPVPVSKKTRRSRKMKRAEIRRNNVSNPMVVLLCEVRSPWRSLARTRKNVNCMACIAATAVP